MKIRHDQLAQAAVHRVAPAQRDAVGLGNGAPAPAAPEQRDDVVVVAHRAHVEQQRRLAVHPERRRGEHRALDAVRAPRAQHLAHAVAGVAVGLEVLPQVVEEGLDLARAVQAPQHGELGPGEAEILAAGESASGGHAGRILTRPARRVDT